MGFTQSTVRYYEVSLCIVIVTFTMSKQIYSTSGIFGKTSHSSCLPAPLHYLYLGLHDIAFHKAKIHDCNTMNEIIENMRTTDRIPEGICENNFGKGNGMLG